MKPPHNPYRSLGHRKTREFARSFAFFIALCMCVFIIAALFTLILGGIVALSVNP